MHVSEVAPEEFAWGTATGPAAALDAVRRAAAAADGHDPLDEAAQLHLKHHGLAGARLWLAADPGADAGRVTGGGAGADTGVDTGVDTEVDTEGREPAAGFALRHGPASSPAVDLAVAPQARGRGVGRALAEAALVGDGPVSAWSHGDHPAAARLAAAYRLERVRELWVMRRDAALPVAEVPPGEGVTVRGFRPGDEPELLRVNAAAFAGHPEQGGMDHANLAERMAEPWFDPAGLLVAVEEAPGSAPRMLGFHWTKRHSAALGEVYVVGIDPTAQGRGLGRVLTAAGLRHLGAAGVREVLLYVESDNAPAVRLYTGLGFGHAAADTHVQYRRG